MSTLAIATSVLFLFASWILFNSIHIPTRFDVNVLIMALIPVAFVWLDGLSNLLALITQGGFPWIPSTVVRYALPIAIHIGLCAILLPLLLQASAFLPASAARYALILQGLVFLLALVFGGVVANDVRKAVANSPELQAFPTPVPVDDLKIAREFLATLPADAPLESYVQFTTNGRYNDTVKDAVVQQLLSRPGVQPLLITALQGDQYQRYGAHTVLIRNATPLNPELAAPFKHSVLLSADDLAGTLTTSDVATRFAAQGFAPVLYPAMQRLQQVAGPPRSRFGGSTGRHALATWLRRNQPAR